ncbi:VWA domain-containing protein [Fulvivirga imtechensis]|uniref:VWA domain-containing protein n=1 Tax=Fulvivirga imtechensis TaxID=881893 RepID=UPI0012F9A533|nr:VWA domain-containing protein [Fulvivirga imtechensis]
MAGLIYGFLLYRKSGPWGPRVNKLLFVLRAIAVAGIAALLVSPILRQIRNYTEDPTLVFAVDNSRSVAEVVDSIALKQFNDKLRGLAADLQGEYNIEYRDFTSEPQNSVPGRIDYGAQSSNIHGLLNDVQRDYEGRNLGGVVLISDGIYNEGMSPTFSDHHFRIHAVGIGDTVPKSDLSIVSLLYNKISYEGNRFPLVAQLTHVGFAGETVNVSVVSDGNTIARQLLQLGADNQVSDVKFLIEANKNGYQRYQVLLERKQGEFTYTNNVQQAYVEVIEGKQQIALIAPAPHPDIKAIRSAIESNANYSIDQYILSMDNDLGKLSGSTNKYDLIIYHQIPDNRGAADRFIQKFQQQKVPTLTILGPQTNVRQFNQTSQVLAIDAVPNEYDKVTAVFNQDFTSFKLSDALQQSLDDFPPINTPFGRISMRGKADVLLYQKVGNIVTSKPLIAVSTNEDVKNGVVLGDGLWKWKLMDYAENGNNEAFNELVGKLVQYLSSKEDKRKFKAYPVKNEFLSNEKIVFDTEVYNDLYERVYGNKIDLAITNAEGETTNYSFVTNENNTRYTISGIPEGVYQYNASTLLGDQREAVKGQFLVKELQLETINLTADFDLLRRLAHRSGGEFVLSGQIDRLLQGIKVQKAPGIIHTQEKYLPFIHLKWLFFFLLGLLTIEWFIRKHSGSY